MLLVVWPFISLAAPAPVNVSTSESPTAAEKPAKSKADLRAERRARQDSERASKKGQKEGGQQSASSKPKATPNELQPGNSLLLKCYSRVGSLGHQRGNCNTQNYLI